MLCKELINAFFNQNTPTKCLFIVSLMENSENDLLYILFEESEKKNNV